MDEALAAIEVVIRERRPTTHVVLNAGKVSKMASLPDFRELMARFDMVHADGASVVLASRLVGDPLPERVAGIDLMERLVERSADTGYRVFLLGARQAIVEKAAAALQARYPALEIAGLRNGYWDADDPAQEDEVVRSVRESRADILFVGMPTPRKELFLTRQKDALGVPFAMGVGGSFDVLAGLVRRAPLAWQKAGMEWAYRLVQEPRRMWKRYLVTNTHFAWLLAKEMVSPRKRNPPTHGDGGTKTPQAHL